MKFLIFLLFLLFGSLFGVFATTCAVDADAGAISEIFGTCSVDGSVNSIIIANESSSVEAFLAEPPLAEPPLTLAEASSIFSHYGHQHTIAIGQDVFSNFGVTTAFEDTFPTSTSVPLKNAATIRSKELFSTSTSAPSKIFVTVGPEDIFSTGTGGLEPVPTHSIPLPDSYRGGAKGLKFGFSVLIVCVFVGLFGVI